MHSIAAVGVGHPVPLFTYRTSPRVYRLGLINYDVSPDGRRFLLAVAADENNRPLTLLQNWTNLLPSLTWAGGALRSSG